VTLATPITITELADRLAIQDLIYNYNRAVDRRDDGLVESLFAPDAVVGERVGIDAIRDAFRATWSKYTELHHLSTNVVVTIDGDRATARSKSIMLRGTRESPISTAESPTYVLYQDEFVRHDGVWRFSRRSFTAYPATPPRDAR